MSIITKGRRSCRALLRILRRICKWVLRQLTGGKGELERAVLGRTALDAALVTSIARSLARSTQVEEVRNIVFGKQPFVVSETVDKIVGAKKITDSNVVSALTWSLQVRVRLLKCLNRVVAPKFLSFACCTLVQEYSLSVIKKCHGRRLRELLYHWVKYCTAVFGTQSTHSATQTQCKLAPSGSSSSPSLTHVSRRSRTRCTCVYSKDLHPTRGYVISKLHHTRKFSGEV